MSILNSALQATVAVTDGDGDLATSSVNIGSHVQFQDDGPLAAIATTGQTVSLDESAGNQLDSNDVTGPIAAFAGDIHDTGRRTVFAGPRDEPGAAAVPQLG